MLVYYWSKIIYRTKIGKAPFQAEAYIIEYY